MGSAAARPAPTVMRLLPHATAVIGVVYVLGAGLLLVRDELPRMVGEAARIGVVANIVATAVLAVLWYVRVRRRAAVAVSPEAAAAPVVEGLDVQRESSLARLRRTSERVRELDEAKNVDAIELVRELLSSGFSVGASDIHITPEDERLRITYRIDGILHEIGSVGSRHTPFVINRIKVMAKLSIHVHAKPQDGRFTFDREEFQARVSTLPTNHGEKVVIRLAVNEEVRYELDRIGFDDDTLTLFKTLLMRDHGVIYLTGPTGSGKTTTMYASMLHIRETLGDKVNLVTLEDPIEVGFRGIAQTQVNAKVGLTFAAGLRSILRQDPDVIMVGEIRDDETAQTAIRAGLTGHLLLTTVHADSTIGVFHRLKQMDVDAFQLAGASIAVVNQRLAIKNCPDCTEPRDISDLQRKQLKILGIETESAFSAGRGCEACRGKGQRGRVPLIELLCVTDRIRDLLIADTPKHRILEAAVEDGMVTLGMQALRRAEEGQVAVDEVIRVLSL